VVGTPLYRTKYENNDPISGYVAAAEPDLILSLYQIPPRHPAADDLRNSLRGEGYRDGSR
jgi:hypothetical protein